MKLNIMIKDNNQEETIENAFNNTLETKIEIGGKISTTTMTRSIKEMPNALIIQYYRFNNTTLKLQHKNVCYLRGLHL